MVALQVQFPDEHFAVQRETRLAQEAFARLAPRHPVQIGGFPDPALRHRDLAELEVEPHAYVRRPAAKPTPGNGAPAARVVEGRAVVVHETHPVRREAAHHRFGVRLLRDAQRVRHHRATFRRVDPLATDVRHQAAHDVAVQVRGRVVARLVGGPVAHRPGELVPSVPETSRRDARHATHERQLRVRGERLRRQQAVRHHQPIAAFAQPQPHRAGVRQHSSDKRRVLCRRGMLHRRHRLAAPRQRRGRPPVHLPVALRRVPPPPPHAMLPDQRVQPSHRPRRAANRSQQPAHPGQPLETRHRARLRHHLVEQLVVDPLQQPGIEHQVPVRTGQPGPQTRLNPVLSDLLRRRAAGTAAPLVAPDAQRHGPTAGVPGHGREFPTRQLAGEEARDLRPGEAQLVGADHRRLAAVHQRPDIESRRQFAPGQSHVQPTRPPSQQQVQQRDGPRVGQSLHLVHGQHARSGTRLQGPDQQRRAVLRHVQRRTARPQRRADIHTRPLERERQVVVQQDGIIAVLERQPRRRHAAAAQVAAAARKQGRLPEPAARQQHRQAPVHRRAALDQLRPRQVARGRLGDRNPMPVEPRRHRFPAAAVVRVRPGNPSRIGHRHARCSPMQAAGS